MRKTNTFSTLEAEAFWNNVFPSRKIFLNLNNSRGLEKLFTLMKTPYPNDTFSRV